MAPTCKLQGVGWCIRLILIFVLCAAATLAPLCLHAGQAEEAASPESVLLLMRKGEFAAASKQLEVVRSSASDDRYVAAVAGAIRLNCGDSEGALTVFTDALYRAPGESLLSFGQGIARIGLKDLAGAEQSIASCELQGGNSSAILAARRYIRFLRGDYSGTPDDKSDSDPVIKGMCAARSGRQQEAARRLSQAASGGVGDPFLQSEGPLMSFDPARPIAPAFEVEASQRGSGSAERSVGRDLVLAPDDVPRSASYAAYELDGGPLSIVGNRPYSYTWDTRRVANGSHKIAIILYNAAGDEVTRSERTVRVYNPSPISDRADSSKDAGIRALLWSALALKPDRCVCDYSAGMALVAVGNRNEARTWFIRAAAIRSGYRDTLQMLQACGGVRKPSSTVYSGRDDEKCIALTFDDGPKPGVTEPLLDLLKSAGVRATFFVIGRHVEEYPALAKSIASAGMEIENHSYTHRSLTAIGDREAEQEMLETQAAVLAITGSMPVYIRPPGGNWNNGVAAIARRWGLTPCMWSVDVFDSEIIGAQKVAETVLKQAHPGAIILMHNGKVSTLQALPTILRVLRERGYRFVTVEELVHRAGGATGAGARSEMHRSHTE